MLTGEKVVLRAMERDEVELVAGWEADPATWSLVNDEPWLPHTTASVLKAYDEGTKLVNSATFVFFMIEAGHPVGSICLWGIDLHNRRAHLGMAVALEERGKGYGTDAIRVLLRYAFHDRGLHRVQLEVLADNALAIAAYRRAGFVEEGRTREDCWVRGRFVGQVIMGVLAQEWDGSPG